MKNINKRRLYLILIIVWMICIFLFSNQNGDNSSSLSNTILLKIIAIVYPKYDALTTMQQLEILDVFGFIIRKTAHMCEYAVLYLFVYQFVSTYIIRDIRFYYINPMITCFIYACIDEFHQLFISGRVGSFKDVLIDSSGAFIMCICIIIINHFISKRKWKQRKYAIMI